MELYKSTLEQITDLNRETMQAAWDRIDSLATPTRALGQLNNIAAQLAGIMGTPTPKIHKKCVIIMGGDHGIVDEGVSAYPQEITVAMMMVFTKGGAGINCLSNHVGSDVIVVDIGVKGDTSVFPGVIQRKIRPGTANMAIGPAMTREEAIAAIEVGIEMANQQIDAGYDLLATGDMGIGNTTPSSTLLAAFTGLSPAEVAGRGTGVDDEGLKKKINAIAKALEVNKPNPNDPVDVLSKVGGLEIAGLTGVILGAAAKKRPVIIDGFISSAAALVAAKISPLSVKYMIGSHCSAEQAHHIMLETIGLMPVLNLEMRLGEGTGAALTMPIVEAATKILTDMFTFQDLGVPC
ncbi:nicotinate-nucleotide--dimethylbenzimidazole phosphoribosyltransferase [Thermincola potens]|uniref:Nicotinate-nucleotide--dimethylbenzimidazole phosphoribosyltransferase n=1 Tax=Thermincola potens (strain JR) TaxID=635013 RepID=D5X8N4_THEPJ|nr:nicotinate-nucleotide--dimethylbenzimidazole phosphoribosyltransferase [Thermincola potens]ADG82910.1 nicotinate-nucleotide/dimethylbenzimidazole phosphoribosyltransferase [Thermincola potens JR]